MSDGPELRVFVCGGRRFNDPRLVSRLLDAVEGSTGIDCVIESGDRAGMAAAQWALARAIRVVSLRGDRCTALGRSLMASRIVNKGRPDLALAFAAGAKTASLLDRLGHSGVRVRAIASPLPA